MAFTKTTWVDDSVPAIDAPQLNRIETGIKDAHDNFNSRINHGTITAASPATLNATTATEHTGDLTESSTLTLSGFTAARPSLLFKFVVSGGGTPILTLATGPLFEFTTTENLTDIEDGKYRAVFESTDDGVNITVSVDKAL